jgi:hypothetical protein
MSTLKAKTIQPVSDSDTLVLRTGGSDSLTLDLSGNATIRGELTVDGIGIGQGPGNYDTNTRVGLNALASTTTPAAGPWNTAFGRSALNAASTGYYNTAVGGQSLFKTNVGFENTGIGLNAGYNNVDGDYNTAIGSQAGPSIGTLSSTTCVGRYAVASASNSVALGFNSSAATANSIYLGNSAVTSLYMGNGSAVAPAYVARAYGRILATSSATFPQTPTSYTGNISSISTTSTSRTTVNFITAMPNANYTVVGCARYDTTSSSAALIFISPGFALDNLTNTTTYFTYSVGDNSQDNLGLNHFGDVSFCVFST